MRERAAPPWPTLIWPTLTWIGVWAATVSAALLLRPLLPVDETRYLAVAWEMWRDHQFIVPHLAGQPYSHKPPLLFWSMHAGWAAFGVSDWWPRLVAPLYALASLLLTGALARALWPDDKKAAAWAQVVLGGMLYWTLFSTVTFFDMPLATTAMIGLLGVVKALRAGDGRDSWRPSRRGFALVALGIGIGILAKGPAILLHILPVALLAPLWGSALVGRKPAQGWRGWYLGVAGALAGGAAIGLAWAVPAGILGGEAYRNAIFWGQSAGRMVDSFAHARPWWWFAAVLPVMVLPWPLWAGLWRSAAVSARSLLADGGARFALIWFAVAFAAFSAISGKQPHYLLPEFPALALLAARALCRPSERVAHRHALAAVAAMLVLIGMAILAVPVLPLGESLADDAAQLRPLWGLLPLLGGFWLALRPPATTEGRMAALSGATGMLVVTAHLLAAPLLASRHDIGPSARYLAAQEREGYALAFYGTYHGQFDFAGRLAGTVAEIGLADGDVEAFLAAHPKAKIVDYRRSEIRTATPEASFPYRGGVIEVWDRALLASDPRALNN